MLHLPQLTTFAVVALGLSVPSYLLGTAGTLAISARALGGIVGITIFTAIYDNKYSKNLPSYVGTALSEMNEMKDLNDVLEALTSGAPAPVALSSIQGLPASSIGRILEAISQASAESWKFVWIAIA
jgi:hypothetical protein